MFHFLAVVIAGAQIESGRRELWDNDGAFACPHPSNTSLPTIALNLAVKEATVDTGTDNVNSAGDTVLYSFVVTNTGHTCLAVESVSDDNAGIVDCSDVIAMGEQFQQHRD